MQDILQHLLLFRLQIIFVVGIWHVGKRTGIELLTALLLEYGIWQVHRDRVTHRPAAGIWYWASAQG